MSKERKNGDSWEVLLRYVGKGENKNGYDTYRFENCFGTNICEESIKGFVDTPLSLGKGKIFNMTFKCEKWNNIEFDKIKKVIPATEKQEREFEQQKNIEMQAIADFDNVLELLLGDYFGNGVYFKKANKYLADASNKGVLYAPRNAFNSSLIKQETIDDMNADEYRTGNYYIDPTNRSKCFYIPKNNERTTAKYCNYIDIAYDYKDEKDQKYCVIIDAKNYGLEDLYISKKQNVDEEEGYVETKHLLVQSLPTNESIYSINDDCSLDNISLTETQEDIFEVYGHHTDLERKKSIFIIRVNLDKLIDEIKRPKTSLEDRRKSFQSVLDDYAELHKDDPEYPVYLASDISNDKNADR